jgi:hypothetical protein
MGSSGSGKFGTYRIGAGQSTGGLGPAGSSNDDKPREIECPSIIENIRLEDVAISDYYINNQQLPPAGDIVTLHNAINNGRLVVKSRSNGETLGNLPTQYNYLYNCMKKGIIYSGVVIAADVTPVPFVVVTLNA